VLANPIISLFVVIVGTRIHHLSPSIGQYLLVLLVSILAGGVFLAIGQASLDLSNRLRRCRPRPESWSPS
jgi:hypothetical protein